MIVSASDVESVLALEAENDAVLIVDSNGVVPHEVVGQRMKTIYWWHAEIIERRHRVDLIQLALGCGPERLRNSTGGLAVDSVPDIPGRVVSQRPDHI